MAIVGIDVSHYQGVVNWPQVAAAGVAFAYAKATDGVNTHDATFQQNWQGAKAAGLPRGAYHFFRADMNAQAQASAFLASVGALASDDLAPMLDIEGAYGQNGAEVVAAAAAWIQTVSSATGRQPIIYTRASFWQGIGDPTDFSSYRLWVAQYPWDTPPPASPHIDLAKVPTFSPKLPGAWSKYLIWQYTAQGKLAGVTGCVDFDCLAPGVTVADLLG